MIAGSPTKKSQHSGGTSEYSKVDATCADSCSSLQENLKDLKHYDEEYGLSTWTSESTPPTSGSNRSSGDDQKFQQRRPHRSQPTH